MNKHYLPKDDIGQMRWLNNFVTKLSSFQETFSISDEALEQMMEDARNLSTLQNAIESFRQYGMHLTLYRNMLRSGKAGGTMPTLVPAPPTPELVGNTIMGDIFSRVSKYVNTIKDNPNYTDAIGQNLGIIGEEKTPDDHSDLKPEIDYNIHAGYPNILWKKGHYQGIHIYINRGDGYGKHPFVDTKPDYLDEHPLPPLNQSVVWKYKVVYIENDEEIGHVSNELSVTVTGMF